MANQGFFHSLAVRLKNALRAGAQELDPAQSDPRVIVPEPVSDVTVEQVDVPPHKHGEAGPRQSE